MSATGPSSAPALSVLDGTSLDRDRALAITAEALARADDGELFLERRQTESLVYDDGKLKAASFDDSQGFGLRAVAGEMAAYAHANDLSEAALRRAAAVCRTATRLGREANADLSPSGSNRKLYGDANPAAALGFSEKIALLQEADAFTRNLDPRVRQVSVSLASDWQAVEIIRADGRSYRDVRPLVRFSISVVAEHAGKQGQGSKVSAVAAILFPISTSRTGRRRPARPCARALFRLRQVQRPPARWTCCSAPAGPAFSSMRRSVTASRAISTARRHRLSPG